MPALTSDLMASWRMVIGLLSPATRRYERTAARMDTRIDDRLATVWAEISTESEPQDGSRPTVTTFSEVYLLRRIDAGWQIAATANSRPTR